MLINNDEIKNIYVAKQFCDMRKQIDDLALIVTSQFNIIMKPMASGFLQEDLKMENSSLKSMRNQAF